MPKEVISGRYFGKPIKLVEGGEDPPDNATVAIGWTNHYGAVQIGIVRPKAGEDDDEQMWLDLDRHGINGLVFALRKARDKSFGKDA